MNQIIWFSKFNPNYEVEEDLSFIILFIIGLKDRINEQFDIVKDIKILI